MKEKTLLLCIAYPDISKKYKVTFCMAGITEKGEFRRIYPIPRRIYQRRDFHKRRWIEYEVIGEGDYRKESIKIRPESIKIGDEVNYEDIGGILKEKATTIAKLDKMKKEDNTSIGIIKPIINDFLIREDPKRKKEKSEIDKQRTITGEKLLISIIPHWLGYDFKCNDKCHGHKILCEDIEVGRLYWNCLKKYRDIETVEIKMRQKLVTWMEEKRDLYFMLGTHYRWKTWLIVSILYPPKIEK